VELAILIILVMAGYSEFEHTRPVGLWTRTSVNADKINI
jgi:hypothetical protein